MAERKILRISGTDRVEFLQGLVTNDVRRLADGPLYAALLTPQGKLIADFFLLEDNESILLDVAAELAPGLMQRLSMYRLRADVTIEETDLHLHRGLGDVPEDGVQDPRTAALGWRAYRREMAPADDVDWDALRVAHGVPEWGAELGPDSYILEQGFERLHGVDFRKGCYVGQEVTARMKHKTKLRKGIVRVAVSAPVEPGTTIETDGKPIGTLHTVAGANALAYLRFDRASDEMTAGKARVTLATGADTNFS
ncbi:MAG: folate-binding protein YgfZ [Rhodobacterales bacterium]|nr:MAG: folate-binding protein YgfZ [Rhodobacterales bacterium]